MALPHSQRCNLSARTTCSGAAYSGNVVVPRRRRRQPLKKADSQDSGIATGLSAVDPESGTSSLGERRAAAEEPQAIAGGEDIAALTLDLEKFRAANEDLWRQLISLSEAYDQISFQLGESEKKRGDHPESCMNIIAKMNSDVGAAKAQVRSAKEQTKCLEARCRDLQHQIDQQKRRAEVAEADSREYLSQVRYMHHELMLSRGRLRELSSLLRTHRGPPVRRAVNIILSDSDEEDPEEDPEDMLPGEEAPLGDPEVEDPEEEDSEDDGSDSDGSSSDSDASGSDQGYAPYGDEGDSNPDSDNYRMRSP